jgi:hypothetical protein
MKTPEAEATLDVVREDHPELAITDYETYYSVQGEGEICIDLDRVSEAFGDSLSMGQWLVTMSSYIGRINLDDRHFRVTSDVLQLEG